MRKYRLFLDRRTWSNASVVIDANSAEEAMEAFSRGSLDNYVENLSWDEDDIEVSIIDVEEE